MLYRAYTRWVVVGGLGLPLGQLGDEDAALLADHAIRQGFVNLTIDLSNIRASMIISAFFCKFLQRVYDKEPASLPKAREITWSALHDFQCANIARWMIEFEPSP